MEHLEQQDFERSRPERDEGSRHLHDEEPTGRPVYVHPNEKLRQEAKALVEALEQVRAEPWHAVKIADAALAKWARG